MLSSYFRKLSVVFALLFIVFNLSAAEYDPNCPEATFSFSNTPIGYDSVSELTLEFTFPNYGTDSYFYSMTGSVSIPEELSFAEPSNLKTTCENLILTIDSGSNIKFEVSDHNGVPFAHNNSTCEIFFDVRGNSLGTYDVTVEDYQLLIKKFPYTTIQNLTCGSDNSGEIEVITSALSKSFIDDPVAPGDTVTLEYTIVNRDRDNSAMGVSFTDDISTLITGLTFSSLVQNECGGSISGFGTNVITFNNGSITPTSSCTIKVQLDVPANADLGKYLSTSSDLTMDIDGSTETFPPAEDFLNVNAALMVELNILDSPQNSGDDIRLEYTITNLAQTSDATGISLEDNLTEFFGVYPITMSFPSDGFCGVGATARQMSFGTDTIGFAVSNASLYPAGQLGDSCTFEVVVTIPQDLMPGVFTNTVEKVTGIIDGEQYSAVITNDEVQVIRAPQLFVSFEKSVAAPGETLNLEYTLVFNENDVDSTDVSFTHDLETMMPGITVNDLPKNGVCTSGTLEFSEDKIKFFGGSLEKNTTCEFEISVTIPENADWKTYEFETSEVTAFTSGLASDSPANSASLLVSGLDFTVEFIDDPLFPGESGVMRYTLDNLSTTKDVTEMFFTHNIADLSIAIDSTMPMNDVCGSGSSLVLSGGSFLVFQSGNRLAQEQCSFDVEFTVSSGVENGMYGTATSALSAKVDGGNIVQPAASDILSVSNEIIEFSKSFSADFAAAGSTIDLEYTITNTDTDPIADITFTDIFFDVHPGLEAIGLPARNVCGAGSIIIGSNEVTFSGGLLGSGETCSFTITLVVPDESSTELSSTSSQITALSSGFEVAGPMATDGFTVSNVEFSKSFSAYDPQMQTATLSYNITNLNESLSYNGISFSDDLSSITPGTVAVGLPQNDVCGAGSMLSGTSFLTLTSGSISPSGMCSFDVEIQFVNPASGDHSNSTSDLMHNGLFLASAATASINVFPLPPVFSKEFAVENITVGEVTTLTFTIDNSGSDIAATGLDFTDNFPAGMVLADPVNVGTTCTGGILTAIAGTSVMYYTGAAIEAFGTCVVSVDITTESAGKMVNVTGDLTSSMGNSGNASDDLTVEEEEVPDEGPDEVADEEDDTVDEEDDVDTGEIVDEIPDEVADEEDDIVDEEDDVDTGEIVDETQDEVADEAVTDDEVNDEVADETVVPDEAVTDNEVVDETEDSETVDDPDFYEEEMDSKSDDDEIEDETKSKADGCGCSLI